MKSRMLIVMGLVVSVAVAAVLCGGCKKKTAPSDQAFQHTPENTLKRIQEMRLEMTEALQKNNLQHVHDSMYYFKGLLQSMSAQLEGEKKQQVDAILRDMTVLADQIDNSAGRKNQAATEANVQKLIDKLKQLESHFDGKQARRLSRELHAVT
jgi:PBP1b-binding outer membrane lipoprotein LpoB